MFFVFLFSFLFPSFLSFPSLLFLFLGLNGVEHWTNDLEGGQLTMDEVAFSFFLFFFFFFLFSFLFCLFCFVFVGFCYVGEPAVPAGVHEGAVGGR